MGEKVFLEPHEPLEAECRHFLDCLTDQTEPRTNGWEGLRVLKVLDEATEILKDQKQKESFLA